MMRRFLSLFLLAIVGITPALAQHARNTPVYQSGLVTPGHAGYWMTNGVTGDAGAAGAGNVTELGLTNTGTPFCIKDVAGSNNHQFCAGANALGGGLLNYQANGTASQLPFTVSTGGPLILTSQTNDIEAKNLPPVIAGSSQLCINPTTGQLSVAAGVLCGGGALPPPVITSSNTANGTVGVPFFYQISATNSPSSFGASSLPSPLSVNTLTGLITGTPTTPGTTAATISATNSSGTGFGSLTITIAAASGGAHVLGTGTSSTACLGTGTSSTACLGTGI